MSRSGMVQTRQASYGNVSLPGSVRDAVYSYLVNNGLDVHGEAYADSWEIVLPVRRSGNIAYRPNYDKVYKIIAELRKKPATITDAGVPYGEQLAALLEEGAVAGETNDYPSMIIDWS